MNNWLNGIRFRIYKHRVTRIADTLIDEPLPEDGRKNTAEIIHNTIWLCYGESKSVNETARMVATSVNDAKKELDSWMKMQPISMR
jgi:hypothetical protein